MPALLPSREAAIRACVALLEALDPERGEDERREFMRLAIEKALEATGTPKDELLSVDAILECFEIRVAEPA